MWRENLCNGAHYKGIGQSRLLGIYGSRGAYPDHERRWNDPDGETFGETDLVVSGKPYQVLNLGGGLLLQYC